MFYTKSLGKKTILMLVALIASVIMVTEVSAQDDLPVLKMRATNSYPESQPAGQALDYFAKRVSELSGGKITVQVYHQGTLYTEDKSIQAVLDGTVEMGMASLANHGPFTKAWSVLEAPYLLDKNQLRKLVIEGDIGKDLKKKAEKDGLRAMMILETGGFRVVGANKLIRTPADIKHLKIRVAESQVILAFYRAAGANPTVVPWGETYLALANKTVDGVDANLASWPIAKLWEVSKDITTNFWAPTASICDVSVKWWNARTPKQRAILDQAAKETERLSMKLEDGNDLALRALLKKNGVTVYDPTPSEMDAWRKVGLSTWKTLPVDQALLAKIHSTVEALK